MEGGENPVTDKKRQLQFSEKRKSDTKKGGLGWLGGGGGGAPKQQGGEGTKMGKWQKE